MDYYEQYTDSLISTLPKYVSHETFATFDIETTVIDYNGEKHGIMYIWQLCVGDFKDRNAMYGRTWREFKQCIHQIADKYDFGKDGRLLIFVHNLAYEFQWLRSILEIEKVFALKQRIPVYVDADYKFHFQCSYKLTNMSLAKFLKSENVNTQKLTMDYSVKRYPDTVLSKNEIDYSMADVIGLHEGISSLCQKNGDTLKTLPMTSTGYVRRDARFEMQKNPENRNVFIDSRLSENDYILCKASARGGDTHANFIYAGYIIKEPMKSKDKASSYPSVMLTKKYPVGRYTTERSGRIIEGCSNIMHVAFFNIRLKKSNCMPYLAIGKCQHFSKAIIDNGRVLEADFCELVITEIDYDIINRQYEYEKMQIVTHIVSDMDYLPKEYRTFCYEMFKRKCELKGKDAYFYAKYKNKINALFGMMLTDICREDIIYDNNEWKSVLSTINDDLKDYYRNKKSFLTYQHGIYVTAWARYELRRGLDACGRDAVYCDTDSVKHVGNHDADFDAINDGIRAENESMGVLPVTVNGVTSELGLWELDAEYSEFITFGAKKYAYKYKDPQRDGKQYGVTVAGLNKQKATDYINKAGLEAFKIGKIFTEDISGRLTPTYNDTIQWKEIVVDGHKCELTSNVALLPTTYTLNITKEYDMLLNGLWDA